MILSIGEIMFDHFPDYRRVGGAPFNFSCHLKKLGFQARFITRVGDDPEGEELRTILRHHVGIMWGQSSDSQVSNLLRISHR